MKKYKLFLFAVLFLSLFLRLFRLDSFPPSLYWDEASLGYNAFTISRNLHDEHGEFLPWQRFIAFGDYKPPGYIYTASFFVRFLGPNEFSVRIASALSGVFSCIFVYLLSLKITKSRKISLIASFLLAVSPWSLHLSRGAFEANLASFFLLLGVYFFFVALKNRFFFLPGAVFFIFSFYTFNANRITVPLVILAFLFLYLPKIPFKKISFILPILIIFICFFASVPFLVSKEGKLRLAETSIMNNLKPLELSNERMKVDGKNLISRVMHNRRVVYIQEFFIGYLENFKGRYLFVKGDQNPRLAVQSMGQMYPLEIFFLLFSLLYLLRKPSRNMFFLIAWILIIPFPGSLAKENPHALRNISMVPPLFILVAAGVGEILKVVRKAKVKNIIFLFVMLAVSYTGQISYYLHDYYLHFPSRWSGEWQYGYKQVVLKVRDLTDKYDRIFVSDARGRPYIYFAFYLPLSYGEFAREKVAEFDSFGFHKVKSLGKISFSLDGLAQAQGRVLAVFTEGGEMEGFRVLEEINDLSGQTVFSIQEKL